MTTLLVNNPIELANALNIAQNALLPQYTIMYSTSNNNPAESPLSEFQSIVSFFNNSATDFSRSQLQKISSRCRYNPYTKKVSAEIQKTYMSTFKEVSDVRCIAAEIGNILLSRLTGRNTLNNAIHEYQKWINEFFCYKNTGSIDDHTAIGLLENRTGVCQAIASVTMLVFPYLGYSVQYISGYALGNNSWGPHAWNAVKSGERWIHVDFTFGMNSLFTPNTCSGLANRTFSKFHYWDNEHLSDSKLSCSNTIREQIANSTIQLFTNKKTLFIGNVAIQTSMPLFVGNNEIGYWIDLHHVLPFLGGACEYIPSSDQFRVCLANHSILIDNAIAYINKKTGFINMQLINKFADIDSIGNYSIKFSMR